MPLPIPHPPQPRIRRALAGAQQQKRSAINLSSISSQLIELLVVTGILFLFSCLFTLPAIFQITSHLISDGGDLSLFAMSHVHQQLQVGVYPFGETTVLRYPIGYNFGVGLDAVLAVLVGAGLLSFFTPIVSYNLTVLLLLTLNGLTSYLAFRFLSKSRLVGLVGAVIYGYSFYVLARGAGHLNLLLVAGLPLLTIVAAKLTAKKQSLFTVPLLYTSGLLLAWGSIQYAIMAVILISVLAIITGVFYPKVLLQLARRTLLQWRLHLLCAAIAGSFFWWSFGPTITAMAQGQFVSRDESLTEMYDIELRHFFTADPKYTHTFFAKLLPQESKPNIEHVVLLGYVEIILLITFFLTKKPLKQKAFLATLFLTFLVFSLGVKEVGLPAPYALLIKHFPFSAVAEPGRYVVILLLVISVAATYALSAVQNRTLRVTLASLVLILLIAERIPAGYFQLKINLSGFKTVTQQPGSAVFNIPVAFDRQDYSLIPIFTGKSIVDGYIHWSTDTDSSRAFVQQDNGLLKRYSCQSDDNISERIKQPAQQAAIEQDEQEKNEQMIEKLKANGIRTVVIHKDMNFFFPECSNVRTRLNLLAPPLEVAESSKSTLQSITEVHNGQLQTTLYFPKAGTFALHGVASSDSTASLSATLQTQTVRLPDSLKAISANGVVFTTTDGRGEVYQEYIYNISAGSAFTVNANKVTDFGSITVWYDYQSTSQDQDVLPVQPVRRLYSDEQLEVLSID